MIASLSNLPFNSFMKIKLKLTRFIFLCFPSIFLCSCASMGPNFHVNLETLKLGQAKNTECIQLFGEPEQKQDKITSDGRFESFSYQYIKDDFGTVSCRYLNLEFKNDELNAYEFVSSFDKDKTKFNSQSIDRLRNGIGKLSQKDVIAILGNPSGKALCPSTLSDYKDKCLKGTEVWSWFMLEKIKVGFSNHSNMKAADIFVTFDSNGKVTDVQSEIDSQQIPHK